MTFYKSVAQIPPFNDYSMRGRTYRIFQGRAFVFLWVRAELFNVSYGGLKLSASKLEAGSPLDVDARVRNTSQRDGDEVVELYLSFPTSPRRPSARSVDLRACT